MFARDAYGLVVLPFLDKSKKLFTTSHVTPFAHINEVNFGRNVEYFQAREPKRGRFAYHGVRRFAFGQISIASDKLVVGTTTAANDVHKSLVYKLGNLGRHAFGGLIVLSHGVGQSCIGVCRDVIGRFARQFFEERFHLVGTERAVKAYREDGVRTDTGKKALYGLSAKGSSSQVAHRHTEHDGQFNALHLHLGHGGIDGSFGVKRVEYGFYQDGVYTALYQCAHLFAIGIKQLVVGNVACGGIAYVGTHRASFVCWANRTAHKAWPFVGAKLVGGLSGQFCTGQSHWAR